MYDVLVPVGYKLGIRKKERRWNTRAWANKWESKNTASVAFREYFLQGTTLPISTVHGVQSMHVSVRSVAVVGGVLCQSAGSSTNGRENNIQGPVRCRQSRGKDPDPSARSDQGRPREESSRRRCAGDWEGSGKGSCFGLIDDDDPETCTGQ